MKTIQEMAREAGFLIHINDPSLITAENKETWVGVNKELEAFAKLVRENEREEIAQFIENTELGSLPQKTAMHYALFLKAYANAIRARSNA